MPTTVQTVKLTSPMVLAATQGLYLKRALLIKQIAALCIPHDVIGNLNNEAVVRVADQRVGQIDALLREFDTTLIAITALGGDPDPIPEE